MDIEKLKEVVSGLVKVQDRYIDDLEKRIEELTNILDSTQKENDELKIMVESLKEQIEALRKNKSHPVRIDENDNQSQTYICEKPNIWKISDNTGGTITWNNTTLEGYTSNWPSFNRKFTEAKANFDRAMKEYEEGYKDE